MYILTGNKHDLPSWCLTPSELKSIQDEKSLFTIHYQSPWPMMHSWAIPERWLKSDPGFPILLRDEAPDKELPSWCYRPATKDNIKKYLKGYRLRTPTARLDQNEKLFLAHHEDVPSWSELTIKYGLKKEDRWCWTGEETRRPPWPKENEVHFREFLWLHSRKIPSVLIDFSFGVSDTYSLLHIHCLLNGSRFLMEDQRMGGQIIDSREVVYGNWELIYNDNKGRING